jgi:ribosomal protein S18 acetylase RimI-like enzyme
MGVVIRPAGRDELTAVGRLTLEAYAASGYIVESDPYAPHLLDAAARAEGGELLVAEVDDLLAGTVTFCPEGSAFSEVAGPGEGEFRMLAVAPSARGRGVAEALVRACVDRSRALGYRAVVLSSLPVQVEAHRLYERLGFRRDPARDWTPRPGIDLLGFELPL